MYQIVKFCKVSPDRIPALHAAVKLHQVVEIPEAEVTDLRDGAKRKSPIKISENGEGLCHTMAPKILRSIMGKDDLYTVTIKVPLVAEGVTTSYANEGWRVTLSRRIMDDLYAALGVCPESTHLEKMWDEQTRKKKKTA